MSQIPSVNEEPEFILPFDWMSPGESFFLPTLRPAFMVYVVVQLARSAKVKVRVYPATKDGLLGVRVWRL